MNRQKILFTQITKYSLFCITVFFLYILQSTPGFLSIFGVKPVLIMPFCFTLCILDESWQTILVYLVSGMLMELSAGRIIGFYTIPILVFSMAGMIAVKFFFKPTSRNATILSFVLMLIILSFDFLFTYMFRGYSVLLKRYVTHVVFLSLYSSLFSILFYRYIDNINLRFMRFDAR